MYLKNDWLKMIGRTVLVTVASFLVVCIFLLFLLSFTAPVAMSRFTQSMGLYGQSAWYSSLQYSYSGELDYLYDAMNISVMAGKDKNVVRYGERLVRADGFEAYCTASDEEEKPVEGRYQYVFGRLSVAYYNLGDEEKSLSLAFSANTDTFVRYNAVTDLVYQVEYIDGNKEFAKEILEKLRSEEYAEGIEDDTCLNEMILQLSKFIA